MQRWKNGGVEEEVRRWRGAVRVIAQVDSNSSCWDSQMLCLLALHIAQVDSNSSCWLPLWGSQNALPTRISYSAGGFQLLLLGLSGALKGFACLHSI